MLLYEIEVSICYTPKTASLIFRLFEEYSNAVLYSPLVKYSYPIFPYEVAVLTCYSPKTASFIFRLLIN